MLELSKEAKSRFPKKDIWLYTGSAYDEVKDLPVMKYIDYVVDNPYIEELRDLTLPFIGSTNQHIIKIKHPITR